MLKTKYNTKHNILLKNKLTSETTRGDVIDEKEIDGKGFWVLYNPERGTRILLSKESYSIVKR